jgi:predicted RNase H-like nuclease (RuvC/YqgF family)
MCMRNEKFRSCCLAAMIVFGMQSLADVAQKEAERRKQVDAQGVEVKVIEGNGVSPNGNLTVSTSPKFTPQIEEAPSNSQKGRASIQHYRSALQKLDKAIQQDETRLETLRSRLQSEKWALPKIGRLSRNSPSVDKQTKLQEQIEELQAKIKQAREERNKIYRSGKKDGFLPGELDGKGIIP